MVSLKKNVLNADLLGLDEVKIFEIGHVFTKDSEQVNLAIGVAKIKKERGVNGETIVRSLLKKLQSGLGADDLNAKILTQGPYCVAEIDLGEIIKASGSKLSSGVSYKDLGFGPASPNRYKKFSEYPFIVRDIAIFVPESVPAEDVWKTIEKGIKSIKAETLVARHTLFDTFKKDGKTSYAYRIVFQASDRTLTDDEANKIMDAISLIVKGEGWEVR